MYHFFCYIFLMGQITGKLSSSTDGRALLQASRQNGVCCYTGEEKTADEAQRNLKCGCET